MYDVSLVGPGLARLRKGRHLTQREVAQVLGVSGQAISSIERAGSSPVLRKLLAYLDAIGATLTDLDRELSPLRGQDEEIARRLDTDAGFRQRTAELIERFGNDDPRLDGLRRRIEKGLENLDVRVRRLEKNGTEDP